MVHFKLSHCLAVSGRWGHRPRLTAPVGVPTNRRHPIAVGFEIHPRGKCSLFSIINPVLFGGSACFWFEEADKITRRFFADFIGNFTNIKSTLFHFLTWYYKNIYLVCFRVPWYLHNFKILNITEIRGNSSTTYPFGYPFN